METIQVVVSTDPLWSESTGQIVEPTVNAGISDVMTLW